MSIEDGTVFGAIFSRLRDREQILPFLTAFQELRQPRCQMTLMHEYSKFDFTTLRTGDEQAMRDAAFRELAKRTSPDMEGSDRDFMQEQWADFLVAFSYDAYDEVDNWWVEWGSLRDLAENRGPTDVWAFEMQVTRDDVHGGDEQDLVTALDEVHISA